MVGTTKKSVETSCFAWLFKKVRHVCEGGLRGRPMYLATVAWDTSMPSLRSSPWIRGAPQSGLAVFMFRMSSRTSRVTVGLPGAPRRPFQAQYSRNPLRCQAITVSGFTMSNAECQFRQKPESQTQNTRSAEVRRSRPHRDLFRTVSW